MAETCRLATPWLEAAWWFHSGLCLEELVQLPLQRRLWEKNHQLS